MGFGARVFPVNSIRLRQAPEGEMARTFVPFGACLGPLQSSTRLGLTRLSRRTASRLGNDPAVLRKFRESWARAYRLRRTHGHSGKSSPTTAM